LSSGGETKSSQKQSSSKNKEGGEDDANELVLTPGEQVVLASRLTMWAGIAAFASVCAYFIIRELMPTYVTLYGRSLLLWLWCRVYHPVYESTTPVVGRG
jgi:hypothetical protein